MRYFIPQGNNDPRFEELQKLAVIKKEKSFAEARKKRIKIESKVREISSDIVQFRVKQGFAAPSPSSEKILGIYKLGDEFDYSFEKGIQLETGSCII